MHVNARVSFLCTVLVVGGAADDDDVGNDDDGDDDDDDDDDADDDADDDDADDDDADDDDDDNDDNGAGVLQLDAALRALSAALPLRARHALDARHPGRVAPCARGRRRRADPVLVSRFSRCAGGGRLQGAGCA